MPQWTHCPSDRIWLYLRGVIGFSVLGKDNDGNTILSCYIFGVNHMTASVAMEIGENRIIRTCKFKDSSSRYPSAWLAYSSQNHVQEYSQDGQFYERDFENVTKLKGEYVIECKVQRPKKL